MDFNLLKTDKWRINGIALDWKVQARREVVVLLYRCRQFNRNIKYTMGKKLQHLVKKTYLITFTMCFRYWMPHLVKRFEKKKILCTYAGDSKYKKTRWIFSNFVFPFSFWIYSKQLWLCFFGSKQMKCNSINIFRVTQ